MAVRDLILPDLSIVEIDDGETEVNVDGLGTVVAHANKACSRLIMRFQKPAILALTRAIGDEIQEAENMMWQVLLSRYLDHAEGVSLRYLGARVHEPWQGQTDAEYRVRIRARIRINRSRGGPEDILDVARLLGAAGDIENTGNASMRFTVRALPTNPLVRAQLAGLLGETRSAGVRLYVIVPASSVAFTLGSVSDPDVGGYLGSVSDPSAGSGELVARYTV